MFQRDKHRAVYDGLRRIMADYTNLSGFNLLNGDDRSSEKGQPHLSLTNS